MADTRIYRKIYKINYFSTGETYSLINVDSISAQCIRVSDSYLMETPLVYNESTGFYFVILTNNNYSPEELYEIIWSINYVPSAPIKELVTRFKFDVQNSSVVSIVEGLDYDIDEISDYYNGLNYQIFYN